MFDRYAAFCAKMLILSSVIVNVTFLYHVKRIKEKSKILAGEPMIPELVESKITFTIDHGSYDPEIHRPHEYSILHTPPPCNNIDLLFAIKSIPKNRDRRNALRKSWLNPAYYKDINVQRVFLFGQDGMDVQVCHVLLIL